MLSSVTTSVVFTALLATLAVAQNSTTFDPTKVDLTTKNNWCNGELTNCPLLCGGKANTQQNTCSGSTLEYNCTCANGKGPSNIDQYQGTLPNFICEATFAQCRQQNPGSSACTNCGTLQPSNVPMVTPSSSMASSSATASATSAAANAASSSSSKAAGPMETVFPAGLAGGVLAALLL